jgi:hypothetical protein
MGVIVKQIYVLAEIFEHRKLIIKEWTNNIERGGLGGYA